MLRISQLFLFVCIVFSLQAQDATFSGKVFLQGAYDPNTSLMRTALLQQGSLPLLQPYNLAPWYHNGTEALISTQAGMVDWILVDLRTSPDTAIARKAAILYTDGTIRDATGDSILHFNVPSGLYYLAIMHRSHLSTMTATKHVFQNGAILDFIDTNLQVYGTCMIGLGTEKRGMIGGDVNQDRVLKYSGSGNDRSPILQRILTVVGGSAINATTTGYFTEDLRIDGTVKYSGSGNDPSLIIQNIITLTGSNAINTTFTGAVPHAINLDTNCHPQPDQAIAGPDSLNITGTTFQLQASQAVNGTGLWTILSGTGGSLANGSLHNTSFTGQVGTTYTLAWTISNPCGSSSDTVLIGFSASQAFTCGATLTDTRDGQQYSTVQIGTQCWMAKNLNIGVMVNSVYTGSSHSDVSNNGIIEKYCYNNDAGNCAIYGGLYDWDEMMGYTTTPGTQGICPTGWHIPTDGEWFVLADFLGGSGIAGGKMKETGTTHWNSPNTGATNSSGFMALGTGHRDANGIFINLWDQAYFWSSSESSSNSGIYRSLIYNYPFVLRYPSYKTLGFSVRCLRNN